MWYRLALEFLRELRDLNRNLAGIRQALDMQSAIIHSSQTQPDEPRNPVRQIGRPRGRGTEQ
jgi:DNA-binding transcriptional MerR regulator